MQNIDDNSRKLHPWLRIVNNGNRVVNAGRADGSARVASSTPDEEGGVQVAPIHIQLAQQEAIVPRWTESVQASPAKLPKRPKLNERPSASDSYVNVYIEFFPEQQGTDVKSAEMERVSKMITDVQDTAAANIPCATVARRNFLCATIPIPMLEQLKADPAIAFVHPSEPLKLDRPQATSVPPKKKITPKAIGSAKKYGRGEKVLMGIIDVEGFDFSHPDFLDDQGKTRFIAIWDQGGDFRPPPKGLMFGSEFRKAQMDAAIAASKKAGMPPAPWIERQSQLQPASHGTHVASIAAGNSGVCPGAKIAAVLLDVPAAGDDVARRRSTFSDTSRITHAVEYLLGIAEEENLPIVINISLGTNGGSHDGASGVSRWLDAYLAAPGRAICVAAGNAGQEKSQTEGDLGWVMGRIHTSGQIPARGLEVELEWTVVGDGIEDWSENELEIWYSAQDRFAVSLKPPGEAEWFEVKPREYVENRRLPSGVTLSVYNELYHPTNGVNYIGIYLSPNFDPATFRGITPGVWKVRLRGEEVRDGRFDAWIERDDPMEIGREAGRRMFFFPSFFTEKSNVDSHSITSLACGHRVIAVANLDEAKQQINASSSQGPTRDGRCKPEIAAPGTEVIAANGFGDPDEPWIAMTGTSMASPYVTGVIGLMLSMNSDLTAAQCLGILQRTARPLAGASYKWLNDMGFGRLDPEAALEEARSINKRVRLD
ncbi:MAG TPA: S8 family serine peptidase [Blastocatellia bacterium]|nr:S8 family serine peptidase [Blastocatellia bacterium]